MNDFARLKRIANTKTLLDRRHSIYRKETQGRREYACITFSQLCVANGCERFCICGVSDEYIIKEWDKYV